jgi:hypothetical protein
VLFLSVEHAGLITELQLREIAGELRWDRQLTFGIHTQLGDALEVLPVLVRRKRGGSTHQLVVVYYFNQICKQRSPVIVGSSLNLPSGANSRM